MNLVRDVSVYHVPKGTRYRDYILSNDSSKIPTDQLLTPIELAKRQGLLYHNNPRTRSHSRIYVTWKSWLKEHVLPLELVYVPYHVYIEICHHRFHTPYPELVLMKIRRLITPKDSERTQG